nr:SDR family NAD(P)-dependent oxidoreductase [Niabella ginsenosidivorans]
MEKEKKQPLRPGQVQEKPGTENEMHPRPQSQPKQYEGGRLAGKKALITGGDSGIGKAIALLLAKEGAHLAIAYLNEDADAADTQRIINAEGGSCSLIRGDISKEEECIMIIEETIKALGGWIY